MSSHIEYDINRFDTGDAPPTASQTLDCGHTIVATYGEDKAQMRDLDDLLALKVVLHDCEAYEKNTSRTPF